MTVYRPEVVQFNIALSCADFTENPAALDELEAGIASRDWTDDEKAGALRNVKTARYVLANQQENDDRKDHRIFTPRQDKTESSRLRFYISEEDHRKVSRRGPGLKGTVTDLGSGQKWKVYGASCGLPHCYCDAVVHPEATD